MHFLGWTSQSCAQDLPATRPETLRPSLDGLQMLDSILGIMSKMYEASSVLTYGVLISQRAG